MLDKYLTYKETAEILRVSVSTIRRWVREGKIHPQRIGKKPLVLETDIPTFMRYNHDSNK